MINIIRKVITGLFVGIDTGCLSGIWYINELAKFNIFYGVPTNMNIFVLEGYILLGFAIGFIAILTLWNNKHEWRMYAYL